MGHAPLQVSTKFTVPLMRFSSLGSNRDPTMLLEFSHSEVWIVTPLMGSIPIRSRRIQFVDGSHNPLQNPTKFAGIVDEITLTRRQYCGLAKAPNQSTLPMIQIKHPRKVWSSKYYLNINCFYSNSVVFAYAGIYYLSRINMNYVYLVDNHTRHMVYTWGIPFFDYSLDVLVSCD